MDSISRNVLNGSYRFKLQTLHLLEPIWFTVWLVLMKLLYDNKAKQAAIQLAAASV